MNLRHLMIFAAVAALSSTAFAEDNKAKVGAGADMNVGTPAGNAAAGANIGADARAGTSSDPRAAEPNRNRGASAGTGAGASVKGGKRPEETTR